MPYGLIPSHASRAVGYAAATDNLRSATRWLLTAAAVAAGAMVAGLQLTSIGSLSTNDWPRLVAAAAGLTAALGGVGYMVLRTSRLLTDEWITLAQLQLDRFTELLHNSRSRHDKRRAAEIRRIYEELHDYRAELFGSVADSIQDLYHRLDEANKAALRCPTPAHARAADALRSAADTVVQAANYSYIQSEFAELRRRLAQAGAVFIVGVVIFAYAANPPKPSTADGMPRAEYLAFMASQPMAGVQPGAVPPVTTSRETLLAVCK